MMDRRTSGNRRLSDVTFLGGTKLLENRSLRALVVDRERIWLPQDRQTAAEPLDANAPLPTNDPLLNASCHG